MQKVATMRREVAGPFRRRLVRHEGGAAALEFAVIAPGLIALILAILYTALCFLAQQMLESAAEGASRMVLTGAAQTIKLGSGRIGMNAADFKDAICHGASGTDSNGNPVTIPVLLPAMLDCARLTVNVKTAVAYTTAGTGAPTFQYDADGNIVSTGTNYSYQSNGSGQGVIVILQLIYLMPVGQGPLGFNLVDQPNGNRMLTATSVFTTESFSCNAGQATC